MAASALPAQGLTVAQALPALRIVWANAPAPVFVVHTHIYCPGYDAEDGTCVDCGGGGCTTCMDPNVADQVHVFTSVAGVHLNGEAAKAHARALLRGLFVSAGGSAAALARTKMRTGYVPFALGFEPRGGSGEQVFAASLEDRANGRVVAATVHKTALAGVSKTRAAQQL